MTEQKWLAATRPGALLSLLRGKPAPSDRKSRLFAVACCRRVADHIPDVTLVEVIDGCERLAEHLDADEWNPKYLDKARRLADRAAGALLGIVDPDPDHERFVSAVRQLTAFPIYPNDCSSSCVEALCGHDDFETGHGELLFQADLFRDIVPNPFRHAFQGGLGKLSELG